MGYDDISSGQVTNPNAPDQNIEIGSLLIDIEASLRQLNLWQSEPPSLEALASSEPFCIDTLNFPQWLQFVFLVKMAALLQQQQDLPSNCSITPMAEEYFSGIGLGDAVRERKCLLSALSKLDALLSLS